MTDFKNGDSVERIGFLTGVIGRVVEAQPGSERVWVNWPDRVGSSNEPRVQLRHANQPEPSKPRVYLAGPMRSHADFNFPAFDRVTRRLRALGWDVFSPAEWDRKNGFDPKGLTGHEDLAGLGFDLRNALSEDLDFITTKADAVAVLDGWDKSSGARSEVATAHALGLPVAFWGLFGPDGTMPDEAARIKIDPWEFPRHQVVSALSEIAKDAPRGHGKIWASAEVAKDLGFTGPEPILTNEKWDACKASVADARRFATCDLNNGPANGPAATDAVNHPAHYTSDPSGVECITITRHRNFNIGNAIKYLWRAGLKESGSLSGQEKQVEDLKKAVFYITDEIKRLGGTP